VAVSGITETRDILKMNKSIIILLSICSMVYGQSKFSEIEKFLDIAVYIHEVKIKTEKYNGVKHEVWLKNVQNGNSFPKTYKISGTGFFILTDVDNYLVTAAHVAQKTSLNTDIVVKSKDDTPQVFKLQKIVMNKDTLSWTEHPNADVSAIQLDRSSIPSEIFKISLPFGFIFHELKAPFREREVTVFGYPMSLGIGRKISPITKTSKPSSGLIDISYGKNPPATFYLLDDPGVSGFSGGPVFEFPQQIGTAGEAIWVRVYQIVGLIHGTISDKIGGFTAVVPSYYIKEIVEMAPGYTGTKSINYNDGKIWSERVYRNGVPWTVLSNFNNEGKPQEKGSLKDGNGTLYIYDEKSKLIEIITYENGSLIGVKVIK
jgi:hypothetical protein